MKRLIKSGVLTVVLLLWAGYLLQSSLGQLRLEGKQDEERKAPDSISTEQLAQAKTIFNERCARCHGTDGRGQTVLGEMLRIPDFTDEKWWKEEKSDRRFISSIRNGKGDMPGFARKLSRQEINYLVAYVRRFNRVAR